MIKQKISFSKNLAHLRHYIIFSLIMAFLILYDWANSIDNNKAIYIIYLIFGFVSIVTIYVHLEYYFTNYGVIVEYDKKKNEIRYKRRNQEDVIIAPEVIKKVEINQSRLFKKKGGFLPTDNYHFTKFILHGNTEVIITSLLYVDLDYKITEKTKVKERIIASIHLNCV